MRAELVRDASRRLNLKSSPTLEGGGCGLRLSDDWPQQKSHHRWLGFSHHLRPITRAIRQHPIIAHPPPLHTSCGVISSPHHSAFICFSSHRTSHRLLLLLPIPRLARHVGGVDAPARAGGPGRSPPRLCGVQLQRGRAADGPPRHHQHLLPPPAHPPVHRAQRRRQRGRRTAVPLLLRQPPLPPAALPLRQHAPALLHARPALCEGAHRARVLHVVRLVPPHVQGGRLRRVVRGQLRPLRHRSPVQPQGHVHQGDGYRCGRLAYQRGVSAVPGQRRPVRPSTAHRTLHLCQRPLRRPVQWRACRC